MVVDFLIGLSLLSVVATLGLGLFAMAQGGEAGQRRSNQFMRWRVWTQAVAIGVLLLSLIYKTNH